MGLDEFGDSFSEQLATESWTLYSIAICFIGLRTYARIHLKGVKGLAVDDYLMLVAAGFYTMLIVCLNVIAEGGGSNLYPPEQYSTFTSNDIKERIKGSKIVIVSEQAMLNVIYTIKVCMLVFYTRLTMGLAQQKAVKFLAIYVACGWVGTEFAFFFSCRPFNGYWAVPPPNPQCTTLEHYAITQGCFNITSDLIMMAIPLPLVLRMTVPIKQKIILSIVFSMGIFVVVAAILTKVFNLTNAYSTVYMLWYVRESSVAIYVSNIPMIWPFIREVAARRFPHHFSSSQSRTRPTLAGVALNPSSLPQSQSVFKTSAIRSKHGFMSTQMSMLDKELADLEMLDMGEDAEKHGSKTNERGLIDGVGIINVETTFKVEEDQLWQEAADGRHTVPSDWVLHDDTDGRYRIRINAQDHVDEIRRGLQSAGHG